MSNLSTLSPVVRLIDSQPKTTSLDVAKFFGKRHDNVLRDIQKLVADEPAFSLLNFEECLKINELANGKSEIYYTITRDGFIMLAMGYTGARARKIKIAYITAFNAMEAGLRPALGRDSLLALPAARLVRLKKIAAYWQRGFNKNEIALVMGIHRREVCFLLKQAGLNVAQGQEG